MMRTHYEVKQHSIDGERINRFDTIEEALEFTDMDKSHRIAINVPLKASGLYQVEGSIEPINNDLLGWLTEQAYDTRRDLLERAAFQEVIEQMKQSHWYCSY